MVSVMNTLTAPDSLTDITAVKVGDIFLGTAGYEACLATFVKIVAIKNKTVKVVELDQIQTGDWMAGTARPAETLRRDGEILTKRLQNKWGRTFIKWNDYCKLYPWDGHTVNTYNHH